MATYKGPKTCRRIVWPGGDSTLIVKRGRFWHWTTRDGHAAESSHQGNVIDAAIDQGARVDTVTHPDYIRHLNRKDQPGTGTDELRNLFRKWEVF